MLLHPRTDTSPATHLDAGNTCTQDHFATPGVIDCERRLDFDGDDDGGDRPHRHEEKLDKELAGDIRLSRSPATVYQVKQHLLDKGRLYRLTIRGRNYLAAIPIIGEVHGLQIIHKWHTVTLLDCLAELLA